MNYEKRYRLQSAPQPTNDGSGCIIHDIWAEARNLENGEWFTIPGRHKSIAIPASELQTALAQSGNPAIIAAYKAALATNLNTVPQPVTGWGEAQLELLLDSNDIATEAAAAANEWITVAMGLSYPVHFAM